MNQLVSIGINTYGMRNALPGARQTARGFDIVLEGRYPKTDRRYVLVNRLYDAAATKLRIGNAIQSMCGAAKAGDRLYLVVIGHGTKATVKMPDGTVKSVSAFVPYDALPDGGAFDPTNLILPWEWAKLLSTLPVGVQLTVILDCCFAAGVLSQVREHASRYSHFAILPAHQIDAQAVTAFGAQVSESSALAGQALRPGLVEMASCGDGQESIEEQIGGHWYSVFGYELLYALEGRARPAVRTNEQVFEFAAGASERLWTAKPALYCLPAELGVSFAP